MKNRIKRAMDAHLACLYASDASRAAILDKVRGGKTMKRKLSLGLVLALALILAVIGALAAVILSNKEFVDRVLFPKALENASESWDKNEMNEILRLAESYGVALDREDVAALNRHDENYKSEVLRLFARAELGFYPSTWSIEDQAWYDQLLVEGGLKEFRELFVPEGNEISQAQALDIAHAYIRDHFDKDAKVTDTQLYLRHLQYMAYSDNPYQKGRQWYIAYEALDPAHSSYTLTLLSDGTVKDAGREMGLGEEGRPALAAHEVLDLYRDLYGDHASWSMGTWLAFQKETAQAARNNPGALSDGVRTVLKQAYALPGDSALPREAAVEAAARAVAAAGGPEAALLEGYRVSAVYFAQEGGPIWKVTFWVQTEGGGIHMAELDAYTGEPRRIDFSQTLTSWTDPYVSSANPAVGLKNPLPQGAGTVARPDGTPRLWYSDAAPDDYWRALDAVGYTSDTAGRLMAQWEREYGTDTMFWPLEAQAIDAIWHNLGPGATVLPGLPAQGDIPRDQAVGLAWQAFRQAEAGAHDAAWFDGLKAAVSFTFNTPQMGDRQWMIQFVSITPTQSDVVGYAALNAVTGEFVEASWIAKAEIPDLPAPMATLRPDGRPALWYSDRASASFWQALDAVGYTADTAQEMERQWAAAYGEDPLFWPLKEKTIYSLWHEDLSQAAEFPALPEEGDMPEEEAVALAKKMLHQEYDSVLGAQYLDSLKVMTNFHVDVSGKRIWYILLTEASSGDGVLGASVTIDAQTGEVLEVSASRSYG